MVAIVTQKVNSPHISAVDGFSNPKIILARNTNDSAKTGNILDISADSHRNH